jgi:hypothetical protein
VCSLCAKGTYSAALGATAAGTCAACGADTYQPNLGAGAAAACLACPDHSHYYTGGTQREDCVCNWGYEGPNGGPCAACNSSGFCVSGVYSPCRQFSSTVAPGAHLQTDCYCNPGYYGDVATGGGCGQCLSGSYCPGGAVNLITACPWGRYSPGGAVDVTGCYCPANSHSGPGAINEGMCTCDPGFKKVASEGYPPFSCAACGVGEICYNDTVSSCPAFSYAPDCLEGFGIHGASG